jgi:ABC-type branched-subunit amino acid transport system substrate-binding protein
MSSRNGWRHRASARGLCIAVFGALAAACSLLVNTNDNQCVHDSDCGQFGAQFTCNQGLCVGPQGTTHSDGGSMNDGATTTESGTGEGAAETGTGCTSNSGCTAGSVCIQSVCVSLKSSQCSSVLGAADSNGAIAEGSLVFGAILPTPGAAAPSYLASLGDVGKSMTTGLSLAVDDFASVNGLPAATGSGRRSLVFVTCADDHSISATQLATKHLVSDLGVPAIIGSGYSTFTNAIAAQINALGKDTLLLAPRSTGSGPSMGSMDTWRIALPDSSEATALAVLANYVEGQLDGGTANVSIAYKGDEYGKDVANLVGKILTPSPPMNSYGNSDDATMPPGFAAVVATVMAASPRIIVLIGTDEAVVMVLQAIESGWTAATRPSYVLSSGMLTPGLWKALASGDPTSVRTRILGVAGGALAMNMTFGTYQTNMEAASSGAFAITSGAPQTYDAVYMLAYSTVAIGNMPINGLSLVTGFPQLSGISGAAMIGVGAGSIPSIFMLLSQGTPIALQGASGSLLIKGQARSAELAQVWCIPAPGGTPSEAIFSGLYVDANGVMQGSLSSACN